MIKKWEFYNSDEKLVDEICERYNLNKVIGKIIVNRHVVNDEDVDSSNILQMYNDYTITDNITIDNYMSYYNVEKDND